jgi:HSP20 family protein
MTLIKRSNGLFPTVPSFFDDFFTRDLFDFSNTNNIYGSSMPAVNIREDENQFEVEVAAPGLNKEDFKIEIENDVLSLSSEKETSEEGEEQNYKRREFRYTSFKRTFTLPENVVDSEKIAASYKNGVLHVTLPKREEVKPKPARRIKIG